MLSILADAFMTATFRNSVNQKTGRRTPYADRSLPSRWRDEKRYERHWEVKTGMW